MVHKSNRRHYATVIDTLDVYLSGFCSQPKHTHAHTGVATKFTNPAKATLSASEAATLSSGKAVLKQSKRATVDAELPFFDVSATPDQVWKVITSFGKLPFIH